LSLPESIAVRPPTNLPILTCPQPGFQPGSEDVSGRQLG
jgi:hypothetical protein